jgi:hypothetical protein
MALTVEQVLALAPDAGAAAAGRKLATTKPWHGLGRSERAIWGDCQGSALYHVRVDLTDLTTHCTCPSRKVPCKHGLGMLLLAASTPGAFEAAAEPEAVAEWLAKRAATTARSEARAAARATTAPAAADAPDALERAPDPEPQAKRAEQRLARVQKGVEALDLWMNDLVRSGIAGLEAQPPSLWEQQAARLVDAQAPGLASRVRRLAHLPGRGAQWPARMLHELGRIALLTHAFRRLGALSPGLQADVRQLVGWTVSQEELAASGEVVEDDWVLVGQWVDDDERLRAQRNWYIGVRTGRRALVLQFAAGSAPFGETHTPGTAFEGELVFWPSAMPVRAAVRTRRGAPRAWSAPLPGFPSIDALLDSCASAIALQPWTERFGVALSQVVPVQARDERYLRDASGAGLRLASGASWRLFAVSGGGPVDVAGEWDGDTFLPLGAVAEGEYHVLHRGAAA